MAIPPPSTFIYKVDPSGHSIGCDVYVPSEDQATLFPNGAPILLFIRMSGFMCFSRSTAGPHWWQSGTKRGYVVVNLDHRLAPQTKIDGIYQDIADACRWARDTLPSLIPHIAVYTSKLIVAGGSAGGHLALLAGSYLEPKPLAIISLYALADPTVEGVDAKTFPNPPRGRTQLIELDEVEESLDEHGPVVSASQEDDIDLETCSYKNRGAAMFYLAQEGLLYPKVYGTTNVQEIRERWSVPWLINQLGPDEDFPPTFLIHSESDSYNHYTQSTAVYDSLVQHHQRQRPQSAPGESSLAHKLWIVTDEESPFDTTKGKHLEHSFDSLQMAQDETGDLDKIFARKVWDEFLSGLVRS
ncbi:Alpha/beta hydrolase fold-3 [Phaffia rhodozyma]|uniref:Alpha/beta hydrolase fold-3 n=1 Tax=Phaffia rhodozyma TaxID=264483 RepID=A0A0F7SPF7_PHARH|nr:Alpha/beta hydrolase fold-3 [Phaffia rhodozyma]